MENLSAEPLKERLRSAKSRMFALRNGIVADSLRKGGSPYRIIFGLNMPQLAEMAAAIGPDRELAEALHANASTRESLLLAPMLMPREDVTPESAMAWIAATPDVEAADILCFKLLRFLPFAMDVAVTALDCRRTALERYTGLRLLLNLMVAGRADLVKAAALAEDELRRQCRLTSPLARRILQEISEFGDATDTR